MKENLEQPWEGPKRVNGISETPTTEPIKPTQEGPYKENQSVDIGKEAYRPWYLSLNESIIANWSFAQGQSAERAKKDHVLDKLKDWLEKERCRRAVYGSDIAEKIAELEKEPT